MLLNKYFGELFRKMNLVQFESIFANLHFDNMDNIDALKMVLYYFIDRVLTGRKNHFKLISYCLTK